MPVSVPGQRQNVFVKWYHRFDEWPELKCLLCYLTDEPFVEEQIIEFQIIVRAKDHDKVIAHNTFLEKVNTLTVQEAS